MAAAPANPDEFRMSFGDHLEELRGRLVRAMLGVFLMAIITFVYGRDIVKWLSEPLSRAQIAAGLPPQTVVPDVTAGFFIYIKISLIGALILAAPWVLFQMWKFIEAGLYAHERKVVYLLAPFSTAMMVLAVAFMYYVMLPVSLAFLLFFAVSFGPSGGQSKDPLAFLSKYVSSFAGGKDGEGKGGWHPVGVIADSVREHPAFLDPNAPLLRPGLAPGSESGLEIAGHLGHAMVNHPAIVRAVEPLESLPTTDAKMKSGYGRVPELDADPDAPEPGQMWVNRRENALKVRVDDRTLVAYLAVSSLVSPLIDLQKYINFVLFMTLGIVIAFQMPVAMTVLGWTGILKAQMLGQYRKYMFFICFCLGAIITPSSDPVSMTLMAMPLYLLFELGLILMRLTQRPLLRAAEEDDWEDDDEDDDDDDEEYEDDDEGEDGEGEEDDDESDEEDEEEDPREQPLTT